ncbi:MAG: hypothetical protein C4575_00010 [Desulforudis sp.]|jgi:hypothetical protein|nr:hypothetical protein [Clostridia bacterium]MDQ7791698.1 hypothetical protein [Clostridia bacterium]RJX22862.1 MAG: hypothetical protein C4575_00010 [Desulforudis sp.]
MAFEVFLPEQEAALFRRKQPVVAISKNSIRLNKTAYEKLAAESVELAYDRDVNAIRVRRSDSGFKIQNKKITSKGFFKHFGLNLNGKFLAKYIEQDRSLVITLNSAK